MEEAIREALVHAAKGCQVFMGKRLIELGYDPRIIYDIPGPILKQVNPNRPDYFEYYLQKPEGEMIYLFSETLKVVPHELFGFGIKQELQNEKR